MARKSTTRGANGAGAIRQRPDGRWEGRYSYQGDFGAYKRGSVYASTQKECRRKLAAVLAEIDAKGAPQRRADRPRYTVCGWLDAWMDAYGAVFKPSTRASYRSKIRSRIKPAIGDVRLDDLRGIHLQRYYISLTKGPRPLSPKSIMNIHSILHSALDQAVALKLIPENPSSGVKLPHVGKPEIHPLMDNDLGRFFAAARGDKYEAIYQLAIFSGLRQSEILGLQWPDIDLDAGTIRITRQLQRDSETGEYIWLDSTKSWHSRTVVIAPSICALLRHEKALQAQRQLAAGPFWDNPLQIVFTDACGGHLKHHTVYNRFKRIVRGMGRPDVRFHDLRHSYAIAAIEAGDSIKSIQEQLGHYSSAFTLDVYADVSRTMQEDTRQRMEGVFQKVSKEV